MPHKPEQLHCRRRGHGRVQGGEYNDDDVSRLQGGADDYDDNDDEYAPTPSSLNQDRYE